MAGGLWLLLLLLLLTSSLLLLSYFYSNWGYYHHHCFSYCLYYHYYCFYYIIIVLIITIFIPFPSYSINAKLNFLFFFSFSAPCALPISHFPIFLFVIFRISFRFFLSLVSLFFYIYRLFCLYLTQESLHSTVSAEPDNRHMCRAVFFYFLVDVSVTSP